MILYQYVIILLPSIPYYGIIIILYHYRFPSADKFVSGLLAFIDAI